MGLEIFRWLINYLDSYDAENKTKLVVDRVLERDGRFRNNDLFKRYEQCTKGSFFSFGFAISSTILVFSMKDQKS